MNIFKSFKRGFAANRQSYIINMLSLIPGLICCLLIMLWIVFEMGFDRSYPKIDRIVKVSGYHEGASVFWGAPPAVAPALKQELPEVEEVARLNYAYDEIVYGTEKYRIVSRNGDAGLFGILDMKFKEGVPFTDAEQDKCVIQEKVAKAIFGNESALDKFLEFGDEKFVVCGVVEDFPRNTTIDADVILPISRLGNTLEQWYNNSFETFVLLKDPVHYPGFSERIKDRAMKAAPENKLYLTSGLLKECYLYRLGNIKNVRLMGIIALFVLIIACINFVNLATAGFVRNSFQTGIRKVVGATRRGLILNNLFNTFLLILISFVIAMGIAVVLLPWFNSLIYRDFVFLDFLSPEVLIIGVCIIVITTLLAGIYPAFYVSSFNPVKVLKGKSGADIKGRWFRNVLVITQFTIAIVLIICTTVVAKQIHMFQQMDLGYNRQEVLYVYLKGELSGKASVLKQELKQDPAIIAVCLAQNTPAGINWNGTGWSWEGKDPAVVPLITFAYVDEDWAEVLGVRFKEGGFFSKNSEGIVINQKLAELMGGTSWIDRYIDRSDKQMKIVGVLDNFMYNNFKAESAPLVIMPVAYNPGLESCLLVRAEGKNLKSIHQLVKQKAEQLNGGEPVSVRFLNDSVENMLISEKQSTRMVSIFSVLAVIISCLGLFGLATFMIQQKRKEIGVRRVNGARIKEIVLLLNMSFLKPVFISFLIACPLSYYFMSQWLENYLQRTGLDWWIFAGAGMITAVVAVGTLFWQSLKAATENPVKSLKME